MTDKRSNGQPVNTTRDQLIEHATQVAIEDPASLTIDNVAARAEVSRATAYRHLSGSNDLRVHVAQLRGRRLVELCQALIAEQPTAALQLEEVFVYVVREVKSDAMLNSLFDRGLDWLQDPVAVELGEQFVRSIVVAAQQSGEWRDEIDAGEIVQWLMEQFTLLIVGSHHMETDIRTRVRKFIVPSLCAHAQPADDLTSIASSLRRHARRLGELAAENDLS